MSPPRDTVGLSLRRVHDLGRVIRVHCNLCRGTRYYEPASVALLMGDVEVDSLRRRLKCEGCGKRDYVEVDAPFLTGEERSAIRVRELARIDIIRRPVWRER